jgi:threonine aldolase
MSVSFASDNNAPIAPAILRAIEAANDGDAVGYGHDPYTERAIGRFRSIFGQDTGVYFAFNGTGANVVALGATLRSFEAVIAPASAHLNTDECGALERITGCKILPVATGEDGKLTPALLTPFLGRGGDAHHVLPRAVSISQATEFGTVYSLEELRALCEVAHANGLFVHVDGARIANAAVALDTGLRESTRDCGVDVLTFGGTKNGLMAGEAVLFFDEALHGGAAQHARKQTTQLASKMRFIAAQFEALLAGDLWLANAAHANAMTARLAERVAAIPGIEITRTVQTNAIFATLDRAAIARAQAAYFFYTFDPARPEVRWMTSYATRERDVDAFAEALERAVASR